VRTLLMISWVSCLMSLVAYLSVVILPLWYIPNNQEREYGELNFGLLGLYEYCPNLEGFPNVSQYMGLETDCRWVSFANCRSDVCIFSEIDYTDSADHSSLKEHMGDSIPNVTASICRNYDIFYPEPAPGMTEDNDFLYQLVLEFPGRHRQYLRIGTPCQYYKAIRVIAPFGAAIAAAVFLTSTLGVCCDLANSRWVGAFALGLVVTNVAIAATCTGLWAGVVYANLYRNDTGSRPSSLGPSFYTITAACVLNLATIPAFCIWATLDPIKDEDEETSRPSPPRATAAAGVGAAAADKADQGASTASATEPEAACGGGPLAAGAAGATSAAAVWGPGYPVPRPPVPLPEAGVKSNGEAPAENGAGEDNNAPHKGAASTSSDQPGSEKALATPGSDGNLAVEEAVGEQVAVEIQPAEITEEKSASGDATESASNAPSPAAVSP